MGLFYEGFQHNTNIGMINNETLQTVLNKTAHVFSRPSGMQIIPHSALPDDSNGFTIDGEMYLSYVSFVRLLCIVNNWEFKGEPYKAVFDLYGLSEKGIEIVMHYMAWKVKKDIDKIFSNPEFKLNFS